MPYFREKPELPQGMPDQDRYGEALRKIRERARQKETTPPPKEEKKDTSLFGGKPFVQREKLRGWLKTDEAWRITKTPLEERPNLEKKLFDPKRFGELIDKREVEKVYKEIKDFPTASRAKYGIKSEGERLNILKGIEKKLMGK